MTPTFRHALILTLASLVLVTACSQEQAKVDAKSDKPAEEAETPTPLSLLAPGQRVPEQRAVGRQYAYMLVDIVENDDAVSGTMRLEIDGYSDEACADEFDADPWRSLCGQAAAQGDPIQLEAPVEFMRSPVSQGDSLIMAGAYGSFSSEALEQPIHFGYVNLDAGDMLLIQQDAPAKDAPVISRFKLRNSDNAISRAENAKALIAERRT